MTAREIINYKISMMNVVDDQRFTNEEKIIFLSNMFIILKEMEAKQREPISNDFTNEFDRKMKTFFINPTIPSLDFMKIDTFITISRKLENGIALTEKEATDFLNSMCTFTKLNIFNYEMLNDDKQTQIDDYSYGGQCGLGSQLLLYHFRCLGLEVFEFDIFDMIASPSHEIAVVEIPINTGKKVISKTYLLDCTYRQFSTIYDCNQGYNLSVGYYMNLDEEKKQFADQLLKNGFFELTEENVKLYFDGFYLASQGEYCFDYEKNKLKKPISYTGADYLELIEKIDILTPLDVEKLIEKQVVLDCFSYAKIGQLIGTYYSIPYKKEKILKK